LTSRRRVAAPPQVSSASSPSVIAHARNDRAAIRALALSDTSCRRRTRRSRLCGNRGPTNVRANSAASSSVRTVTSRARRRGGSNTKFVMHRKLASHNRSSGGARSCSKPLASASITRPAGRRGLDRRRRIARNWGSRPRRCHAAVHHLLELTAIEKELGGRRIGHRRQRHEIDAADCIGAHAELTCRGIDEPFEQICGLGPPNAAIGAVSIRLAQLCCERRSRADASHRGSRICPPCLIGIEAGMATHYVARELSALGHDVKQVPATYAKPFRQGHKNDFRGPLRICTQREKMNEMGREPL
jgi:hypothetical protein